MTETNPLKYATDMARQIHVSSALNPLLWMLPLLIIGLLIASFSGNIEVIHFFIWAISVVIFVILVCYVGILLFGNTNLLRSEKHAYRMKRLEIIGDEKHELKTIINQPQITNPSESDPSLVEMPKLTDDVLLIEPQNET